MATPKQFIKQLFDLKGVFVEDIEFKENIFKEKEFHIYVRLGKGHAKRCPFCNKKCPGYDELPAYRKWRSLDINGSKVYLLARSTRVCCKEHGVHVENVPWALPDSSFTKQFEMQVAYLVSSSTKEAVRRLMRIDWQTVGRCITRVHKFLEPDVRRRYDNLVNIGIDETSYKKGHKYITTVVNLDTGTIVWCAKGHDIETLSSFFEELSQEQRASIKTVAGDGARWIDACVNKYIPHAKRCIDPFHVVCWANEVVDKTRKDAWKNGLKTINEINSKIANTDDKEKKKDLKEWLSAFKEVTKMIKGATYIFGKAPENLTTNQKEKLEFLTKKSSPLSKAYEIKEHIRLILKLDNIDEVREQLKTFYSRASRSRVEYIVEFGRKIKRHEQNILNTITTGKTSAIVEALNGKISLMVSKARGFKNIENFFSMIMLYCGKIKIPLPHEMSFVEQKQICSGVMA